MSRDSGRRASVRNASANSRTQRNLPTSNTSPRGTRLSSPPRHPPPGGPSRATSDQPLGGGNDQSCGDLSPLPLPPPSIATMSAPTTAARPGAMSLLDKYAQINTSIDDARRRVADARAALEQKQSHSARLREERTAMLQETSAATAETTKIEADLKAAKEAHRAKLAAKERAEREHRLAQKKHDGTKKRIDDERAAFLERCREFRASCKRMRVAASLLVLDGGCGTPDAKEGAADDADLWRRLQEEEFSDDDEEEERGESPPNAAGATKRRKRPDPEMERVEGEEREAREELIEAECALDSIRSKNADAVKRSNARTQKLTQQRAQLTRHRKEVEDLERQIQGVKDDIVEQNQLANAFEQNVYRRQQRESNAGASRNHGSYSGNFNPPHEAGSGGNRGNDNPYGSSYRTPQTTSNGGTQPRPRAITNPYAKQPSGGRTPLAYRRGRSAPTPPRASNRGQGGRTNGNAPQYASDAYGQANRQSAAQPPRGRNYRNQRQFGTSVGVSLDTGMTDELREGMSGFAPPASTAAGKEAGTKAAAADDVSDISSSSSDDEELLSFSVFGK